VKYLNKTKLTNICVMPAMKRSGYNKGRKTAISRFMSKTRTPSKLAMVRRRVLAKRKSFKLNTHSFSRFSAANTLDMTGTEQPLSFEFSLSSLYSYSEFTTLFDKYRLDKAVVYIQMINNPNSIIRTNLDPATASPWQNNNFYPKMWYISDHDDSSTTTIAAIKERVGVKCCVMKPNVVKRIVVKPACAVQLYRTATTTGYGPKYGQFIDMAQADVPHYGLKCVFDPLGLDPNGTFQFRYEWKLYFTCKDVQ
jgi:hypothetical protein